MGRAIALPCWRRNSLGILSAAAMEEIMQRWEIRSIKKETVRKIKAYAAQHGLTIAEALDVFADNTNPPKATDNNVGGPMPSSEDAELNHIRDLLDSHAIPKIVTSFDQIVKEVRLWHAQQVALELNDRAKYNKRVRVNVEAAAQADSPAEWTEPVSGRKLYNEAAVVQQVEAAALAERKELRKLFNALGMKFGASAGSATGVTVRNGFGESWDFQLDREALNDLFDRLDKRDGQQSI
jgi:hypothetical protein